MGLLSIREAIYNGKYKFFEKTFQQLADLVGYIFVVRKMNDD